MKPQLIFKLLVVLPAILFADYIIMVIFGCASCMFGSGEDYYCGPYCTVGKILIGLSGILFLYIIFPDLKAMYKSRKNGQAGEEQES